MRLVSYLKAFAIGLLFLAIVACSGGTSEVLPQATIPLPQSEDGDSDTAYLSVSTPNTEGYVDITSSDDLIPVDVNVVVKVLFQDDLVDEIDSGDVDESDDDVCEEFSGLPVCPDLDGSNRCQTDPDDYGALSTKVPARVSDFVVVEYAAAGACDVTSLVEIQVDDTEVSQEFKKDDSGAYAKSGNATGGSNSTKDSYQKSDEYVVDVYVEKVAEDIKKADSNTQSTTTTTTTSSAEELRELKEEIKDKVTVVESTETQAKTTTAPTTAPTTEPTTAPTTEPTTAPVAEQPVEEVKKILPTLPSNPDYFKKFILDNFSTAFFNNTYGITKPRVHVVPFLKIINDELVIVVGVKQPYTTLLAYYVITTDISYDEKLAKFSYTFTDYEFLIKSMPSFFAVGYLVHDEQGQTGDFLSYRDNISRSISIMDLRTLTVVKTKYW